MTHSLRIALVVVQQIALASVVGAHSWYDKDCCSDHDCAPILEERTLSSGEVWVRTERGAATFRHGQKNLSIRPSQDDKEHACIVTPITDYGSTVLPPYVRCLYRKAGA